MSDTPAVLIGSSLGIRQVREEIECAARSNAKVLITGESGTGKEIVARLVHDRSHRARGPLVTINCAGVPDSLLESELFGHMKGSFTDAWRDKRGLLESASGGTVFLDEIGEMTLRMQALLLRFLETGEIQRVGSDRHSQTVNVRVITATHRQLLEQVAEKTFREDLFYRLNVVHIEVPPLRERRDDVPLLLDYFLKIFSEKHGRPLPQLGREAIASLSDYDWPGNVRELRNVTERLVLKSRAGAELEMLVQPRHRARAAAVAVQPAEPPVHEVMFDRLIAGACFWSEVCEPFMARDLTRRDLRLIVRMGLEHTRGSYKQLVQAFNMPPQDYRRFLNFLRKFQCHEVFQSFRMMKPPFVRPDEAASLRERRPQVAAGSAGRIA
jgi:transcriptional regulator with GAF, ATPase, and Fis domain